MAPRQKAATGEGDKPESAATPARRSAREKTIPKPSVAPAKEAKEKKEAVSKKTPARKDVQKTKEVVKKATKATSAKSTARKAETKKPAPAKPSGVNKRRAPVQKARTIEEPKEEKDTKKKVVVAKKASEVKKPAAKKATLSKKATPAKKTTTPPKKPAASTKKPAATTKKTAAASKKAVATSRKRPESKKRAAKNEEEEVSEDEGKPKAEVEDAAPMETEEAGADEKQPGNGDMQEKAELEQEKKEEKKPAARKPRAAPKPKAEPAAAKRGRKRGADEVEEEEGDKEDKAAPSVSAAARPAKRARAAKKVMEEPTPVWGADKPALDLFVFGTNPFGALGLGEDETVKYRPAQVVVEGTQFVQVVCGGMHTVALSTTGELWTWGVNDEGALGRVTGGTCWEAEPEDAKANPALPGKAAMPEGVKFVAVAAGDGFTLALSTKGVVYGCGTFKDDVSSLTGFTPSSKIEKTLMVLHEPKSEQSKVEAISAGARHCVALTADGQVLTWGIASQGQLGRVPQFNQQSQPDKKTLFMPLPVDLSNTGLNGSPIVGIATGSYTTFVITKSGDVAAWGLNGSCQLGLDKNNDEDNIKWKPVKVPAFTNVAAIKGGEHHTLVLTKEGKVLGVGSCTYGCLGRSGVEVSSANAKYPEPAEVEGLQGAVATCLAANANVSGCVTDDGNLWLWGSNVNFQMAKGDDDEDCHLPEKFRRPKSFGWRKITSVSLGGQHGALLAGPQGPAPTPAAAPDAVAAAKVAPGAGEAAAAADGAAAPAKAAAKEEEHEDTGEEGTEADSEAEVEMADAASDADETKADSDESADQVAGPEPVAP